MTLYEHLEKIKRYKGFLECHQGFKGFCLDQVIFSACIDADHKRKSCARLLKKDEALHPCQCGSGEERMTCSAPYGWEFCG